MAGSFRAPQLDGLPMKVKITYSSDESAPRVPPAADGSGPSGAGTDRKGQRYTVEG